MIAVTWKFDVFLPQILAVSTFYAYVVTGFF